MSGEGSLGAAHRLFRLPGDGKRALVAATSGAGAKAGIAAALRRCDTVGADVVNDGVNAVLVTGAEPLFFLDYLAGAGLSSGAAAQIADGVHHACRANGCAVLGGATAVAAALPDVFKPDRFELAGTVVGMVDLDAVPDTNRVSAGDAIVGLPSTAVHGSGCALAHALIGANEYGMPFDVAFHGAASSGGGTPGVSVGGTFGDALLAPVPSYMDAVRAIRAVADVKSMAYVVGGGLSANVAHALPEHVAAVFEQTRWDVPPLAAELVRRGALDHEQRYRALDMGVGYVLIVGLTDAGKALAAAPGARIVGFVQPRRDGEPRVVVRAARTA